MEFIQIKSIEYYNALKKNKESFIPVIFDSNYVFVGPISGKNVSGNCLNCFFNNLKENNSEFYYILKAIFEENRECVDRIFKPIIDIISALSHDLLSNVVIIERKNLSIKKLFVHKAPNCECSTKETRNFLLSNLKYDYKFNPNKRCKNGKDIFTEDVLKKILNKHSGIGQGVVRDADSKVIPMYYIKSSIVGKQYYSYGRTENINTAKMAAIFEMLERYTSMVPHTKPDVVDSYYNLKAKGYSIVHAKELILNQFSKNSMDTGIFGAYSDEKIYRWKKVFDLCSEKFVYIPEQVVYCDSQLISNEKRFIYETSNGCALGGTLEEAILYAMFEVIERDAFLVHWYNSIAPKKLDISNIDNTNIFNVIKYVENKGFKINIFDITMESNIPTIWVAIIDESFNGKVKCYNAAGTNINPEKALESALIEVITSVFVYNSILEKDEKSKLIKMLTENTDRVLEMEDHVYFYANKNNFKYIQKHYSNQEIVDFRKNFSKWYENKDITYTFEEIIKKVSKYHKNIYISLLDSEVTESLGLFSVKVIIPSMLTMTFGNNNRRINYDRVVNGPIISGIRKKKIKKEDINLNPHPFP